MSFPGLISRKTAILLILLCLGLRIGASVWEAEAIAGSRSQIITVSCFLLGLRAVTWTNRVVETRCSFHRSRAMLALILTY